MNRAAGQEALPRRQAIFFIVFLGIVSLFGDMTYEGARSITGPFLGALGVSATTIGIVAGFGELLGYGSRFLSGYLGDRTRCYWAVTIVGYVLNLFAVPLLALAGAWQASSDARLGFPPRAHAATAPTPWRPSCGDPVAAARVGPP